MGRVFRARDVKLNRPVAVKVLRQDWAHSPEWLARFEREAQLLARQYVLAAPDDPAGYRLLARTFAALGDASAARVQERLAAAVGRH